MATKDLWKPGYEMAITPAGHETAVPTFLTTEEQAEYLLQADQARADDPVAQKRDRDNAKRRQRWAYDQAPARAWRAHFQKAYLDAEGGLPDNWDHDKERAKFIAEFVNKRRENERLSGDTARKLRTYENGPRTLKEALEALEQ